MGLKVAVLATVGTSILANLERKLQELNVSKDLEEVLRGSSRLRLDDPKQQEFRRRVHYSDPLMRIAVDAVARDPEQMSAELNTIIKFFREWRPGTAYVEELHIRLYPTDTGTSVFCANAIKNYVEFYRQDFVKLLDIRQDCKITCDIVELKGFGVSEKFFTEGIDELLDKYAKYILSLKKRGYKVILAATGGFKPECTYAVIIGLLCGVDRIVYVHEAFRYYVDLPAIPLDVDPEVKELVKRIGKGAYPKHALEQLGINVDELREKGVLRQENGVFRLAEWLVKILELKEQFR